MKPFIVSVAKKTGYVCAALVIIAAVLVILSRFMNPYVDARRSQIEKIASELVQSPVTIDNASVSWYYFQPGVALHNVTIQDKDSKEPLLQLRTVKVFFSIIKSIMQRKPVLSGMLVSGADLVVHQADSGEFVLQGFPALGGYEKEPFKEESKIKDVAAWLSMQPLIILRDIDVRYTGITGKKRLVTLYNLRLENTDSVHTLVGKAILHQKISTGLSLSARWEGLITEPEKINGKIYINLSAIALAQWFQGFQWKGWEVKNGLVSAKIWANWRDGGFQRVQAALQLLNVDLYSGTDQSTRKINRVSGNIGWKREGKDQIIAGDDILIDWSARLWPVTSFYVKLSPDASQQLVPVMLNLGYLDIADMRELLSASPKFLPDAVIKAMDDLDLNGNLENISMTFAGEKDNLLPALVQGRFSRIKFKSIYKLPVVENLAGAFVWKGDSGSVSLQSSQTEIHYSDIYSKPIILEQLTGDMLWQHDDSGEWKFVFKSLGALNEDAALNMNGHLLLSASLEPTVNISANFTVHNLLHLKRYFPAKTMNKDLADWLNGAFLSGEAQSGSLILRGKLTEFPFDHDNGNFIATAVVNNVRLHYAPDWPDLKNISGNVQFAGRKILIDVSKAQIMDIDVGRVHGEIPYLGSDKPAILTVYTTPIHTDFSRGMNFLHQSPLENSIGKMFKSVALKGPIEVGLALTVPLENPDDTEVKGIIDIMNGSMTLIPWKLDITKLTGKVNFTERSTDAAAIQGELFGKPLRLDIDSIQNAKNQSVVIATVNNNMDLTDLENWLKIPFSSIAKGATNVTTKLDLAVNQPIEVHVDTNLTGVTLDLPLEYAKAADDVRRFTADITVSENEPLKLKLNYADLLNAALILEKKNNEFDLVSADLRLGKGDAEWPQGKGLYITGTMSELNADKIKTYLDLSANSSSTDLLLRLIDINVDDLNLYGIKLTGARLQLVPTKNTWSITVTSPQVAGKIDVPTAFNPKSTIEVDLQRINLNSLSGGSAAPPSVLAKQLPSIKFSADVVSYGQGGLRGVSFTTLPSANGMAIQSFTIQSPNLNLQASGDWIQSGDRNTTRLHGKATSKNVSALLDKLGFDVHNFESSNGDFNFDLNWASAPWGMALQGMNGQASVAIGKGRIVEVSQASNAKMDLGRMLNLFSLQSIPRRLSLDFSDVFQKGYAFDSLKGDFKFSNGDASTNNMRFDGPLARVEIRGQIGLAKQNFDMILSVTPYVTSSIPVAATLITGQPVIGVAAWAVNKMIGGEVNKVATYYYAVTGSWDHPAWNPIHGMRNNVRQ